MTTLLLALTFLVPLGTALALVATGAARPGGPSGAVEAGLAQTGPTQSAPAGLVRWCQLAVVPGVLLALSPGGLDPGAGGAAAHVPLLLGTWLAVDLVARPLLLVGTLLYGAALTAVTFGHSERPDQLAAYLLVSYVGNVGVYLAWDTVTFYLAFAVMSFAAYGLVIHTRSLGALRAGRVYLTLTVLSETAILLALLLVTSAGGRLLSDAPSAVASSPYRGAIVALLIIGFGVKAGLFPLHLWLPLAHPAAPPAASAVLSGAMVKAGLVGWLRFLPLGEVEMAGVGRLVVALALVGAFGAVIVGSPQRDPKAVLAYSTVSQMGFLGVVVGVALAAPALAPACIPAAVVYAVHHGLAKGALFLGVPVWKHHATTTLLQRRVVQAGLALAALAVVGAPLSSGSVGKYAAKYAVEGVSLAGVDLVTLLPFVATGSTILLVRCALLLRRAEYEPNPDAKDPELLGWLLLVVTSATVPWLVTEAWVPVAAVPELEAVTVWDATWPILLGLALGAGLAALLARRPDPVKPLLDVPAGDLATPATVAAVAAVRAGRAGGDALGRARERLVGRRAPSRAVQGVREVAGAVEDRLAEPAVSGILLAALLAAACLALWVGVLGS